MNAPDARVGVVGATGAVGTVTLRLLRERGYENVRAFASARSAGRDLDGGVAVEGGALVVDKSSAYRLEEGYPLVVPEVNGDRAAEAIATTRVVANPNCSSIPLTCVLEPLREAAGLRRVRVSTYQAVSGAGAQRMEQLRGEPAEEHDLGFDWPWEGDETEEESKIRAETRKILELPELPLSATTVRIPVLVGHSQSVWVETEEPLSPEQVESVLASASGVRLVETPTSRAATETEDVLVGRIRPDRAAEGNGLVLFLACDNLVKGAALNALQIAELLLDATSSASRAA
ncbi:MAG TPA: Asd/ArgC dimerization domain-containing protein [Gaiellaceae bacterium]|nr:Asd/ArgC dimerization domain-containing protein [Gaiellaceae bacterium]